MAFYGTEFIFDGKSSDDFGMMVYNFGSTSQSESSSFPSVGDMEVDYVSGRYDSYLYGIRTDTPLEFDLVFGVNLESIEAYSYMDRFDIEVIASWLTGHSTWKWLSICQDDMTEFRYKCLISDLQLISEGMEPWAFSCRVTCDSPYAYTYPRSYSYDSLVDASVSFFNRSTHNGYYRPIVDILVRSTDKISITNATDGSRAMEFSGFPSVIVGNTIRVDCDHQIISMTDPNGAVIDFNLYPYFNFNFFRLLRGDNILALSGDFEVTFTCEFPVNVGG